MVPLQSEAQRGKAILNPTHYSQTRPVSLQCCSFIQCNRNDLPISRASTAVFIALIYLEKITIKRKGTSFLKKNSIELTSLQQKYLMKRIQACTQSFLGSGNEIMREVHCEQVWTNLVDFFFCIENQQANLTLNITVIQVTRLDSKIVIGLILAQLLGF